MDKTIIMKEIKLTKKQKQLLIESQNELDVINQALLTASKRQNDILSLIFDVNNFEYKNQEIELNEDNLVIKG
jgi:hypothetical protein